MIHRKLKNIFLDYDLKWNFKNIESKDCLKYLINKMENGKLEQKAEGEQSYN